MTITLSASIRSFIAASVIAIAGTASAAPTSFAEEFDSALDPAWSIFTGNTRSYGLTSPPNHYSLTDRPGYLRYYLDQMTAGTTYGNNYQPSGGYDPALEFTRVISGERWAVDAKMDFYMPHVNGRSFQTGVWFGDPGAAAKYVQFYYYRDSGYSANYLGFCVDGATCGNYVDMPPAANSSAWVRLSRDQGLIRILYSLNGSTWHFGAQHDWGDALDGLNQRLALSGASWWVTAGSYADWDYVRFVADDAAIPLPGTLCLLFAGLGSIPLTRRRRV